MGKTVYCHPDNLELIKKQIESESKQERVRDSDFLHFMNPDILFGIKFQTNKYLEKERPTGKYMVEGNRFYSWWDGQGEPPSWAIFFGLVKPIMEPFFYIVDDHSTIYFDKQAFRYPYIKPPSLLTTCFF